MSERAGSEAPGSEAPGSEALGSGPLDWSAEESAGSLRAPTDSDDKYSRGVVGMRTGSQEYPGAAVLGVEAAWRTGTGMVRYIGPDRPSDLVLQRRPETVTADGRVQAWVIGSGSDASLRSPEETAALRGILNGTVPVIVDAGALDLAVASSAPIVVTPHAREHDRLRDLLGLAPVAQKPAQREASVIETASALGGAVLLKGARTLVATPGGWCAVVSAGSPWLATAGTGDVLAGVIGAVVGGAAADRAVDAETLGPLAATAAWIHGQAARRAAAHRGQDGGPITALDVADALPFVIADLLPRVVARELQES